VTLSAHAYAVKVDDMDAMIRDCYSEAARLCPDELASESRVGITRCMVRKKANISQLCKGHFR
jgi:hypothetical protein